jgi:hypothetical protein
VVFAGAHLELTRSLTALRQEDSGPVLCKLGRGTVLTVAWIARESGLIYTTCMSKMYALFMDDLEQTAQLTDSKEQLREPEPHSEIAK